MKESQTLEFKKSLGERKEILESISALSNTKGGRILVGVEENKDGTIKEVVGVEVKGKEVENFTNEIKQNTDPVVFPSIEFEKMNGKEVLVIEVKESLVKPVFFNGRGFKRVGRSNVKLSVAEIREMTKESVDYSFTDLVCEGATLKDIDEVKVKEFVKEAKKHRGLDIDENSRINEILLRLKLLKNSDLTNAAVLLFGKEPQRFFLQAVTKAIRFKGLNVTGEMIDFKTFEGDVISQLKKTEDFIFDHIPKRAWIEEGKLQRQEKWLYPPKAIREALANALGHRDYATTSTTQVRIFDDRLEVWNPGTLPKELSIPKLKKKHESIPKNPLISRALFWIKIVEEVGTGTSKIVEWCEEWGLPEPEFEDTKTSLVLTFMKDRVTEEVFKGLNDRQRKAITFIKEKDMIRSKDYCRINNVVKDTAHRDLKELLEKNLIKKMGVGKSVHYILK